MVFVCLCVQSVSLCILCLCNPSNFLHNVTVYVCDGLCVQLVTGAGIADGEQD